MVDLYEDNITTRLLNNCGPFKVLVGVTSVATTLNKKPDWKFRMSSRIGWGIDVQEQTVLLWCWDLAITKRTNTCWLLVSTKPGALS